MMGTEIFKIDASWAEKLTKTRVQFLLTPTVQWKQYPRCAHGDEGIKCRRYLDLDIVL